MESATRCFLSFQFRVISLGVGELRGWGVICKWSWHSVVLVWCRAHCWERTSSLLSGLVGRAWDRAINWAHSQHAIQFAIHLHILLVPPSHPPPLVPMVWWRPGKRSWNLPRCSWIFEWIRANRCSRPHFVTLMSNGGVVYEFMMVMLVTLMMAGGVASIISKKFKKRERETARERESSLFSSWMKLFLFLRVCKESYHWKEFERK